MPGFGDIFRRFSRRSRAPDPDPAETHEAAPAESYEAPPEVAYRAPPAESYEAPPEVAYRATPAETHEAPPDTTYSDVPDLTTGDQPPWEGRDETPLPAASPVLEEIRFSPPVEPVSSQAGFEDQSPRETLIPPPFDRQEGFTATPRDDSNIGVLEPSIVEVADDDARTEDPLALVCPYCGAEDQRVGSRCANARCNRVIVRIPPWAQHRRHNWFARRFSWRRIVTACIIALLIVFVIWVNYPFAPDPVVLFKKTQTQLTIDAGPGSWTGVGRDLRHSRRVDIGPPPPTGQIRYWNFDVPGDPLQSEPVAQDTHVYVGSSEGMYALSHADLSFIEKWEGETPGRITSGAAVVGLYLFFGSTDHTVSSWNAFDGQVRWSFPTADTVETAPVVSNGLVYVSSGESWIYALDAHNGVLIWKKQLDSNASNAATVHEGKLLIGDEKGVFYILSARTGQEWFRFRTPRAISGSPVVSEDGERAYFAAGGQLYAVEATLREIPGLYQFKQLWAQLWLWQVPGVPRPKGQQGGLWRFTPENPLQGVKSSPALVDEESGGTLYVGAHDNNVYALDAISGDLLWTFRTANAVWASPLVIKDHLIVGDESGALYSLDRLTGQENWSMNLGAPIYIPPIVSNGLLIVRTADGNVYGIE